MEYETDSTAVLVIDMQNDFCHPDGALYAPGSEAAIDGVNDVIDVADEKGMPVFYTQDTHHAGDPEFEQWGEHCRAGSWGQSVHDEVTQAADSMYMTKSTYDAFYQSEKPPVDVDIHSKLQDEGIETLIICGTLVNVCVQETASSAALRGYDVYVVEDAVGYLNEEQKQAALDHIDFLIGETVRVGGEL